MEYMLLLKALILGVIEGLTEFLPISSTGHLIIASELLDFHDEKGKVFEIVIQTGAMLAIVIIPLAFVGIINFIFMTQIANLFSLPTLMTNITQGLFGTFERVSGRVVIGAFDDGPAREVLLIEPPLWSSWAMLFVICAICLAILNWKVKAYEVVK